MSTHNEEGRQAYAARLERYQQAARRTFDALQLDGAEGLAMIVLDAEGEIHTGIVIDGALPRPVGERVFRRMLLHGPRRFTRWCKALLIEHLGHSDETLRQHGFCTCGEPAQTRIVHLN